MKNITAIKIDINNDTPSFVRVSYSENGESKQAILAGPETDSLKLESALAAMVQALEDVDRAVAEAGDVPAVVTTVSKALSANLLSLAQAERMKATERQLDAALTAKRTLIRSLENRIADCGSILEVETARALLPNLQVAVESAQTELVAKQLELESVRLDLASTLPVDPEPTQEILP